MNFTMESEEADKHASALVAPLNIQKSPKRSQSRGRPGHSRHSSSRTAIRRSQSRSQISPPLTPQTSKEALSQQDEPQPIFYNYLRAFYHFHPSSTVISSGEESSITVPINQGDVILVHSIHPNGWADGTLLASGARGWLPTNYCEGYDHPTIHNLLNALMILWDLVREGEQGGDSLLPFTKQDYVRGMIAGVRCFLEKTECLTRESPLIQTDMVLRRMRKGLLGDLASLVRTAKKLQEILEANDDPVPVVELLDDLVVKGFKLVTRAVRFLDIWAQDAVSVPFEFNDASNRPPTPPSDAAHSTVKPSPTSNHVVVCDDPRTGDCAYGVAQEDTAVTPTEMENAPQPPAPRLSIAFSLPSESDSLPLQSPLFPPQHQTKRLSVTHRVSYTAKSPGLRKQSLASERLNAAQDSFLGFIGSFIGLHLQSRSSDELIVTTQQSVIACRQLLAVVEEVWERDSRRSQPLEQARDAMYARLTELVHATKHMFNSSELAEGDEVVMPNSGKQLVTAATSCVRAAGDCVMKTRSVMERIGDFEFENVGLALSDSIFEGFGQINHTSGALSKPKPTTETDKPLPTPPNATPRHLLPPLIISESKPLPEVPVRSPLENSISLQPTQSSIAESPTAASFRSSRSSLPPVSQLPTPHLQQPSPSSSSHSPASATHRFFSKSARADSVNASVADSSSTYRHSIRGETGSVISQASTRATTPEHSPVKKQSAPTLMSSFGSSSELRSMASEDVAAGEEHLLETTYAHELIYNKEGQIAGGSLPALVEQLTTHESTPDSMFVTAFYLTFRLFTTPVEFARCLMDRFEYIGSSQTVGIPVRLRVYNIFKGWLESHWRAETDCAALDIILSFANGRLREALPAAGKRLADLTSKVTEVRAGALVPRLVSAIGKTGVANTSFTQAEGNVPSPVVTKSQLNALRAAKDGKSVCSILDFDPLEMARQLTIIESKLFCAIQPEELLASEWTKKTGSKAVNVRAMSTLSTDLANLVADTILNVEDAKKRALVIKRWIKIASKCLELNNYDSLMAIICSLNSSMVLRLKRTWELVSTKTKGRLEELKAVTDVGRNYAVLRQRLQNHVAPCIPFVGIYLTDLTFVDVGNGTTRQLPGDSGREGVSVINFDKHMKTAKIIGQLQSFQVPYRLAAIPEMQEWMESQVQRVRTSDQANVQNYYRRSLLLEPREPPQTVKAAPPQPWTDSSASSTFTESRISSKDRFEFLNFHFSTNAIKDR
ncbi:ras guanine-nucleotide exchange protein Cdc25p [Delitschia confertaspora ATCC 74209]|uniref:Ras guanine-nucleotide exchange protein Cdc25p n=1 Tax=Delitschia confertaspora ATCC 74209 TaxID=1513339 RepID=A0A9P4MP00_9PLEO|nr:ras guanine-nucleotide exchange protein Cdc25p [Delitschia confertaspora ATCC 74209]